MLRFCNRVKKIPVGSCVMLTTGLPHRTGKRQAYERIKTAYHGEVILKITLGILKNWLAFPLFLLFSSVSKVNSIQRPSQRWRHCFRSAAAVKDSDSAACITFVLFLPPSSARRRLTSRSPGRSPSKAEGSIPASSPPVRYSRRCYYIQVVLLKFNISSR